jgi:membrane-associated phospholipid phosphatase
MVIPVQDSEYEDLLIHLPNACLFIETALSRGGKVLVHCVMGISRSATVVCAYREPVPPFFVHMPSIHVALSASKSWYFSGFLPQQRYNTFANVSSREAHLANLAF